MEEQTDKELLTSSGINQQELTNTNEVTFAEINESSFYTANDENSGLNTAVAVEDTEENLSKTDEIQPAPASDELNVDTPEDVIEVCEEINEVQSQEINDQKEDEEKLVGHDVSNQKKNEDEGEIRSGDEVENSTKEKTRKRPRDNMEQEDITSSSTNEDKTKKAALERLERLRNMNFAKDPFKDTLSRDRPTTVLTRQPRDRTPPRKSSREENRRRARDEPSTRKRRSRSRGSSSRSKVVDSAENMIEMRHQRSTMFFLQNEQRAKAQQPRGATALPTKPLRDRIDTLLSKPDNEVLTLPATELKALILRGADLFKEQEHFFTGRKAQLIELDSMISKEREDIERISQELPPPYRPPIIEEYISSRREQHQSQEGIAHQQQQHFLPHHMQQKVPDFSLPPPNLSVRNEFPPGLVQSVQHQQQQMFARPPPSISSGVSHFGQSPSLLFTKPPPAPASIANSVSSTTGISSINTASFSVAPNTSIPPPNLGNAPPHLPTTFTMPPLISMNSQQEQQQHGQKPAIPSLLSKSPSQIMVNTPNSGGFHTSSSANASMTTMATPVKPNFSMPPPTIPSDLLANKQQQFLSNIAKESTSMQSNLAPGTPPSASMSSTSPKPALRSLMSINLGFPAQQMRQRSPSRRALPQQQHAQPSQSSENSTSAELTKAATGGGRGRGRRPRGLGLQQRLRGAGRGRGDSFGKRTREDERTRRRGFSSSPSKQITSANDEAAEMQGEAEEQEAGLPTSSTMSSPVAGDGQQADSTNLEMHMQQKEPDEEEKCEDEPEPMEQAVDGGIELAEVTEQPPVTNSSIEPIVIQAADTTSSSELMFPVSP